MRADILRLCAVCVLIASPVAAPGHAEPQATPKTADEAALLHRQAVGDRWPDRWQGRHHYLFDDDNRPETTATNATADAQACATEPVRVRRADGSTEIVRIDRCR